MLWIAFNFVSLQCKTQQFAKKGMDSNRCELLSILYLCSVKHNLLALQGRTCWLWIAFNFVSLQCKTQQRTRRDGPTSSCELLSILYLCSVKHNLDSAVIRFTELWIAFNFVSLQCKTQLTETIDPHFSSCELLSILYLCSVKHNRCGKKRNNKRVVNCFQFCIFAV